MPTVTIQPGAKRIRIEPGATLLQAARQLVLSREASVEAPCGGKGICGRCRVVITDGPMEPPTEIEKQFLSTEELAAGSRLACQAVPAGAVQIEIPPETMTLQTDLQVTGQEVSVAVAPLVQRFSIPLVPTTLEQPQSMWQQIQRALAEDHAIAAPELDCELVRCHDPRAERETVVVGVTGHRLTSLYRGGSPPPSVGLAVDLGTTKAAGYLVDLATGAMLDSQGAMNPQTVHGADVVSRLSHAVEGPQQADRLAQLARECINYLGTTLARRQGLQAAHIEHAVVAANTAMHHLLLRWPVLQLGRSPYVPASSAPVSVAARDLNLDFAPGAQVYLVPPIAGYVGGDHTAMVLASRLDAASEITLGLDIGTNTEIILANGETLLSCSCASGPAFEGAQIRQGVRAVPGAVYQVDMHHGDGVSCRTIDDAPPIGLCGSGVVDAVAGLVREGIVNRFGMLDRKHPRVRPGSRDNVPEFLLAAAGTGGARHDLILSQRDISAIQLAKAAIAAGIDLLLEVAQIASVDIARVIVAGAFGTHLRLQSAITLGLLPDLPRQRFSQVGNGAGTGARMILTSTAERKRAERLARRIQYVELARHARFGHFFAQGLKFSQHPCSL